jgi:hypothetical protein
MQRGQAGTIVRWCVPFPHPWHRVKLEHVNPVDEGIANIMALEIVSAQDGFRDVASRVVGAGSERSLAVPNNRGRSHR